jgi:hypothetical protein
MSNAEAPISKISFFIRLSVSVLGADTAPLNKDRYGLIGLKCVFCVWSKVVKLIFIASFYKKIVGRICFIPLMNIRELEAG